IQRKEYLVVFRTAEASNSTDITDSARAILTKFDELFRLNSEPFGDLLAQFTVRKPRARSKALNGHSAGLCHDARREDCSEVVAEKANSSRDYRDGTG